VDPDRDGPRFQNALAAVPNEKLRSFYQELDAEERRRFHYVANVCLGYESWSRLYNDLVLSDTQSRLSDRLEEALAHKAAALQQREVELKEELTRLKAENQALQRENFKLHKELDEVRESRAALHRQQEQLIELVERYKAMVQELRRLLPRIQGELRGDG
jgi:uncharacterized coiled-coil DUF342 family protein